jgi:hypothetical protein
MSGFFLCLKFMFRTGSTGFSTFYHSARNYALGCSNSLSLMMIAIAAAVAAHAIPAFINCDTKLYI